jgi:hypothetical protein
MRRRRRSRDYVRADHWTNRLKRTLRIGWLVLCLAALAGWWLGWGFVDGAGHRVDHRQLLDTIMGVIAFPAGLLWIWMAPALEPFAEPLVRSAGVPAVYWRTYGPELFAWFGAALIGYIQWFWLLPYVFSLRTDD